MKTYPIYGREFIEQGALDQMTVAMELPIAIAGALMPDAHIGYGLPIGGVLATLPNVVIPYAVGVDIACRMCMSIFDMPKQAIQDHANELHAALNRHTHFGIGATTTSQLDTSLFDREEWNATAVIRNLKDKAWRQLGTSGTGNHFVEWGIVTMAEGEFVALLSHSGSRGFGGAVANYYSQLAMQVSVLPKEHRQLAWLDLNTEAGQNYWLAMNLAGDYASANHHEIHAKIARAMNLEPMMMIENHHNFAWRETLADGTEAIIHRKGATPAGQGVLGIIPGSMTAPGFIVRGKGVQESMNSASHGAGRIMSRKSARSMVTRDEWQRTLDIHGVSVIGADVDEAPMVYKDIHTVMAAQAELVDVIGTFHPRIVRMADARERPED
jgi:tRNA-splicing ligase RtcB (3'-phosphate/5'-hydroxy nucleic acid ligase)